MNKLTIAALIAGTAAVTGVIVSKVMKYKKKSSQPLFDDCDDCCCDSCACEEDLDVIIPAEETEDCAEKIEDAAEEIVEEASEKAEDAAEKAD